MTVEVYIPPLPPLPDNFDALSLAHTLEYVLQTIIARYDQADIPLPERRYWTVGQEPAHDCDQIVVSFVLLYSGPPGDQATEPSRCGMPRSTQLSIEIARPIPVTGPRGTAPKAAEIQAASQMLAIDAWMLEDTACLCDEFGLGYIATVTAGEAQGGFQAVQMTLTIAVP